MVGIDNIGYEDIIEQHGLRDRNENGEGLANLFAFNTMVIGATLFSHKCMNKATWVLPDHTTEN